jgi:hypothetical protein
MQSAFRSSFSILVSSSVLVCCATPPGAMSPDLDEIHVAEWTGEAAAGDAHSQFLVGLAHDEGRGASLDRVAAAKWYRLAADQGHVAAQTNLGLLYYTGAGVAHSDEEAALWFTPAAARGFAPAQQNLGVMHLLGRGVAQDRAEARRLIALAADQGNAKAQNLLLAIDAEQFASDQDPRAEAEAGSATAQYRTSLMYFRGEGVERDELLGLRWLQRAADQGLPDAQFLLGWKLTQDGHFAQGATWISLAAEQGLAIAEAKLGRLYLSGCGVPHDDASAAQWVRRAADRGFALAQYDLGLMYLKGIGFASSEHEAFRWVKLAAEQNLEIAEEKVAFMYENGRGVERDRIAAHRWYSRASSQGAPWADLDLERLERSLEPGELAEIERASALNQRVSSSSAASSTALNASGSSSIR